MISFWSRDPKWYELSNFEPVDILYAGVRYRSVEHAYQAYKVAPAYRNQVASQPTAAGAKRIAKTLPANPEQYNKVKLMDELLFEKFTHPRFEKLLLSTGTQQLSHYAPWDELWGTGRTGTGKDMLGKMLMRLRELIQQANLNTDDLAGEV